VLEHAESGLGKPPALHLLRTQIAQMEPALRLGVRVEELVHEVERQPGGEEALPDVF